MRSAARTRKPSCSRTGNIVDEAAAAHIKQCSHAKPGNITRRSQCPLSRLVPRQYCRFDFARYCPRIGAAMSGSQLTHYWAVLHARPRHLLRSYRPDRTFMDPSRRVKLPMSASSTEVPNVLIVEDEMVLRMRAVDIVEDAGFRPVEAVNADEAMCDSEVPLGHIPAVYRHSDARQHGRSEARPRRAQPLARHQDHPGVRSGEPIRRRKAGRQPLLRQAAGRRSK